jgi:hypothetical protein
MEGSGKGGHHFPFRKVRHQQDPFSGTGTGIFNYDGWSCMGQLREGQSPLVFRQKGGLFKLTTIGGDLSGFHIASAMHDWCHAYNKCRCNDVTLG